MITLIGKDLAKKGNEFIFYGPANECNDCRFKSSCVGNLEEGRKYKIVDIKDNEQKCLIHAENVVIPVEVERSEIALLHSGRLSDLSQNKSASGHDQHGGPKKEEN